MKFDEDLTNAILKEVKNKKYNREEIVTFIEGILFIMERVDGKDGK